MSDRLSGLKGRIAAGYDCIADGFAGTADLHVYRFLAAPLARALAGVAGRVLDVASGTGALARQLGDVVALDLSGAQLAHNPVRPRVQADAEALPFPDASFAAAACAFGVNHFPDPAAAVAEMARVAPLVGVLTWERPERVFAPKQTVLDLLAARVGHHRTELGLALDSMGDTVGSVAAITALLTQAGLVADVRTVTPELPWPGPEAFVDYRLSLPGVASLVEGDPDFRREAISAVAALPAAACRWRPRLVLGLGRTSP